MISSTYLLQQNTDYIKHARLFLQGNEKL